MELKIDVADFSRGLANIQGIVQKRNTMPILANVMIEASDAGQIDIIATDLDIGMRCSGRAEVVEAGSITVNAKALYDIVRALPSKDATLKSLDNNYVEVRAGRVQYKIVGTSAEEFPKLPALEGVNYIKFDKAALKEMVEKTFYSVSTDETRYNLNGVYFEQKKDGALVMVSTDGHRLSRIIRKFDVKTDLEQGVILPRKGLSELRRLFEGTGIIELGVKGSHAVAHHEGITIVMRLIDGTFPDYEQVIPKETERKIKVKREELTESLRRISLVSSDKSHSVKLELRSGLLRISSQNPDLGEGNEELPVEYKGSEVNIGFNARYLIDALNAFGTEQVVLELNDDLSPGVVRGDKDDGYICVVMPMRI
ncbi:MAG: DNA polymerase III subunit beta [Deltaproteobacteria bacterium]|nr:DNA polymerase III subunit beta [Deltaproteobacteria bacterium]